MQCYYTCPWLLAQDSKLYMRDDYLAGALPMTVQSMQGTIIEVVRNIDSILISFGVTRNQTLRIYRCNKITIILGCICRTLHRRRPLQTPKVLFMRSWRMISSLRRHGFCHLMFGETSDWCRWSGLQCAFGNPSCKVPKVVVKKRFDSFRLLQCIYLMIKYDRSVFLILVSDQTSPSDLSLPLLCPKNEAPKFSFALNVWKWLQMIGLLDGSWGPSGGLPATPESCDSGLGGRQTFVYTESNLFMIVFLNANLLALWRNSTVCWPSRQTLLSFVLTDCHWSCFKKLRVYFPHPTIPITISLFGSCLDFCPTTTQV